MVDGRDILTPLVLDFGSGLSKVGFAGDDAPISVEPTIVGRPRHTGCHTNYMLGLGENDFYFGEKACCKRGILSLKRPIACGIITKWDDMEKLLHYTFYDQLSVSPESHPVLLTEPPFNPKTNREKTAEIMFETFHVPAMYLALTSILSLYSIGLTTGLVIECGEDVSHTVPIYEGHAIPHAISKLDLGGLNLTNYMLGDLSISFYPNVRAERDICEDLKIQTGYVALDFNKEVELAKNNPASVEMLYGYPNQIFFTLRSERFYCPEALFQPSLVRMETSGIHEKAHNSIMKCDVDIRKSMSNTIVLNGGSTMFPGFANRVSRELCARAPDYTDIKVVEPEERIISPWIGGSILASLDAFKQMCISRAEYDEYGPAIVHKKCF